MAVPGWYPDPAGTPNQYRFWDGQAWSAVTTANPSDPPPIPSGPGPGPGTRRTPVWILGAALLVVLVVVAVFVIRAVLDDGRTIVDPEPMPSSTASGWDDSSPTTLPTPSITPSDPPPSPQPSTPAPPSDCPDGDPLAVQPHPSDGRVHGGGLSFPRQTGWGPAGPIISLSWAYDVGGQTKMIEPQWQSMLAVGALFTGVGFDAPDRAAELVVRCVTSSTLYGSFSSRTDLWSKAVMVDGRPGWSIRSEIRVDNPQVTAEGDVVEVIVVDTGSPESLAMFLGAVSIGDRPLERTLDQTVTGLRVE